MNVFYQSLIVCFAVTLLQSQFAVAAPHLNFEAAPVNYSHATPQNVITGLQRALDAGEKKWEYAEDFGYLLPLLKDLKIPVSSQMLPFSKTSLQRHLIGPDRPRALYFNDDAYVGYVQDGMLELMVTDASLGMVFYTLKQAPAKPQIQRQVASCMTCHASTRTKNIPGLLVRSMFVDPVGLPVLSEGSFRTDHSSPLSERWGGWYVTGTHGKTTHMGNFHLPSSKRPKKPIENKAGLNLKDLSPLTQIAHYPTPHSDLVALMVFEHQIDAHNFIIRTNYAWQIDVHHGDAEKADAVWKQEVAQLVKYLLFEKEAELKDPIEGTSSFATEFAKQGPFDSQGRSLRQFDLERRLFRFPCSYMIYSKAFQSLPEPVRISVYQRLKGVITGADESLLSQKLSEADRQNLLQILPETLPELRTVWEQMERDFGMKSGE